MYIKGVITSEKGIVRARNNLDPIISASYYYWFWKNMNSCALNFGSDKGVSQDTEGLVLNSLNIPVENEDMEINQDIEIL